MTYQCLTIEPAEDKRLILEEDGDELDPNKPKKGDDEDKDEDDPDEDKDDLDGDEEEDDDDDEKEEEEPPVTS